MTGFKDIHSQMFDVRPVTKKGSLDVEKIQQVTAVLDLRQAKTKREIEQRENALKISRALYVKKAKKAKLIAASPDQVIEEIEKETEEEKNILLPEYPKDHTIEELPMSEDFFEELQKKFYSQPMDDDYYSKTLPLKDEDLLPLQQDKPIETEQLPSRDDLLTELALFDQQEQKFKEVLSENIFPPLIIRPKSIDSEDLQFLIQAEIEKSKPKKTAKKLFKTISGVILAGLAVYLAIPGINLISNSFKDKEILLSSNLALYQSAAVVEKKDDLLAIFNNFLKENISDNILNLDLALDNNWMESLGYGAPKQYLLVFQNPSEIRATGGFIGTYGAFNLDKGKINNLLIEGVLNADSQIRDKIIPPKQLQKISTSWSLHDANWFLDWPASAQKIIWFYEKTDKPKVDGVISMTPAVIEQLLKLTGPIEMPEYKIILSADNFVELVQYKVEIDYDKTLNQPKRILADFAPKFISALKLLNSDLSTQALNIILASLDQKDILIYLKDQNLEEYIEKQGWAGQVKKTEKDYLAVVSSNIKGFKTDRMIEEDIQHQAEIQADGSIIDTVIISKHHNGGKTEYAYWNKTNIDYLRIYLPLGSQLISVSGQTNVDYKPPIDYQKQGFVSDFLIKSIEDKTIYDQQSGTEIFVESGKTVFGNWLYTSPGKTSVLTYKYKLPFNISSIKDSDSYDLLVQKQPGQNIKFSSSIKYPANWQISKQNPLSWSEQTVLDTDKPYSITFSF